jgi:hypothetical protein
VGIQLRKDHPGRHRFKNGRGATRAGAIARVSVRSGVVEDPDTPINFMHENRETSETPAVKPGSRSAGEGDSLTARTYVSEESHNRIVPMNYSNNDKTSSAESGEGRPLIKENAGQPVNLARTRRRAGRACHKGGRAESSTGK